MPKIAEMLKSQVSNTAFQTLHFCICNSQHTSTVPYVPYMYYSRSKSNLIWCYSSNTWEKNIFGKMRSQIPCDFHSIPVMRWLIDTTYMHMDCIWLVEATKMQPEMANLRKWICEISNSRLIFMSELANPTQYSCSICPHSPQATAIKNTQPERVTLRNDSVRSQIPCYFVCDMGQN